MENKLTRNYEKNELFKYFGLSCSDSWLSPHGVPVFLVDYGVFLDVIRNLRISASMDSQFIKP